MKFLITLKKFEDTELTNYSQVITNNYEVNLESRIFYFDDNAYRFGKEWDKVTVEYVIGDQRIKNEYRWEQCK